MAMGSLRDELDQMLLAKRTSENPDELAVLMLRASDGTADVVGPGDVSDDDLALGANLCLGPLRTPH